MNDKEKRLEALEELAASHAGDDYLIVMAWEPENARYYRLGANGERVQIRKKDIPAALQVKVSGDTPSEDKPNG